MAQTWRFALVKTEEF